MPGHSEVIEQVTFDRGDPTCTPCEIARVMADAHKRVFGHWGGDSEHQLCSCPTPDTSIASRIGAAQAERLVVLLTKFAYQVATPGERAEMVALIKSAHA